MDSFHFKQWAGKLSVPRGATRAAAHTVGLIVVDESLCRRIEVDGATELPADRSGVAGDMTGASDVCIGSWLAA